MSQCTGRCHSCKIRFTWRGSPLLRNAFCPHCGKPLHQTTHLWRGENSTVAPLDAYGLKRRGLVPF